jgi:hypothetical protein
MPIFPDDTERRCPWLDRYAADPPSGAVCASAARRRRNADRIRRGSGQEDPRGQDPARRAVDRPRGRRARGGLPRLRRRAHGFGRRLRRHRRRQRPRDGARISAGAPICASRAIVRPRTRRALTESSRRAIGIARRPAFEAMGTRRSMGSWAVAAAPGSPRFARDDDVDSTELNLALACRRWLRTPNSLARWRDSTR